jgi:hypothetical protein
MIKRRPGSRPATKLHALGIDAAPYHPTEDPGLMMAFLYRKKHVYPYLKAQGLGIFRCQAQGATRDCARSYAIKPGVAFITGVGHGTPSAYLGFQCYVFTKRVYKKEEVKGKIIHLLSCSTAKELGPDMVAKGCRAFFGYDDIYALRPDKFATLFLDCDTEIDRAIAEGLPAGKVYRRARVLYTRRVCELYALGAVHTAAMLKTNRDLLRRLGEPRARLAKTRRGKPLLLPAGG